jgi:hypothetical protein
MVNGKFLLREHRLPPHLDGLEIETRKASEKLWNRLLS